MGGVSNADAITSETIELCAVLTWQSVRWRTWRYSLHRLMVKARLTRFISAVRRSVVSTPADVCRRRTLRSRGLPCARMCEIEQTRASILRSVNTVALGPKWVGMS